MSATRCLAHSQSVTLLVRLVVAAVFALVVYGGLVSTASAQSRTTYVTASTCVTTHPSSYGTVTGEWQTNAGTGSYSMYCHPVRKQASQTNTSWLDLKVYYFKSSTYVPTAAVRGKGYIGTAWGAWTSNASWDVANANGNSTLTMAPTASLTAPNVQYFFFVSLPSDPSANSGATPHARLYGYSLVERQ